MMNPNVAVVVVNYCNAPDTIECVRTLLACPYQPLSIVVVDNGSNDSSESILRKSLPETTVTIIETGRNLGFAGGNNSGFRSAPCSDAKYVLLLNNDTLVDGGFLEPLVSALESDCTCAIATGYIFYYPERTKLWYAGGRMLPLRAMGKSETVDLRLSRGENHTPRDTTFVSGCMMLLRAEMFRETGLFDERFFMYCEDAELSRRVTRAGRRMVVVPESRIFHKVRHRDQSPMPLYYTVRNRLLLIETSIRGVIAALAYPYVIVTTIAKSLIWVTTKPVLARAAIQGIIDYFLRRFYEGQGGKFLSGGRRISLQAKDTCR